MKTALQKLARILGGYPLVVQLLILLGVLWVLNWVLDMIFTKVLPKPDGDAPVPWWRMNMWDMWYVLTTGKRPTQK